MRLGSTRTDAAALSPLLLALFPSAASILNSLSRHTIPEIIGLRKDEDQYQANNYFRLDVNDTNVVNKQ